ncbi:DeoR/GlpR family DNA-binding transcription regulator [Halobacillus sp. Cin3]|uniref:DeoR/GlpR family DNA-binding transcription regulator n=1 Tax=Halobacillus sp. Cin3 TaxID=2928441 RepID=UPI00248E3162|nr:DeoR/GlpR family DNA-binding transcription regulator [Halobacillus sp. Cin3]
MFASQRHEKIRQILIEKKNVDTSTLTSLLGVSDVTVRKDLAALEKEGFLRKTFGGAVLSEHDSSTHDYQKASIDNVEIKDAIAEKASVQIQKGDTIFIGSGATCYLLAKKIRHRQDLTIVTNNVNALNELIPYNSKIFFIGGELVHHEGMVSTSSERVEDYFKGIYVNKAFTSVTGVDLTAGLTVNHIISTYIYKKIQAMSFTWTLMVEDTKFNKRGIHQVATLNSPASIISNYIPAEYLSYFEENHIETTLSTE